MSLAVTESAQGAVSARGAARGPVQRWKLNDQKAQKRGSCAAVYWVKERKPTAGASPYAATATALTFSSVASSQAAWESPQALAQAKRWETGMIYKGDWQDNKKSGYGIQIWKNGNKYEGEWKEGRRHGHGVMWEFVGNKLKASKAATATATAAPAGAQTGTAQAQAAGTSAETAGGAGQGPAGGSSGGVSLSSSSLSATSTKLRKVYAGNWKDDKRDGLGVYYYSDGRRYEGHWRANQCEGRGTLYFPNGDCYTGEWRSDSMNGFGTLTRANADVYEGEWLNGKREGQGIYYFKSKEKIYDGEWIQDIPKCGVYCDAADFFDDGAEERRAAAWLRSVAAEEWRSPRFPMSEVRGERIPRLRLEDPDGVLAQQIERIQLQRAPTRNLPFLSLAALFSPAGVDELRRVYAVADVAGAGRIPAGDLHAILHTHLKLFLNEDAVATILKDLGRSNKETDLLTFSEFVKAAHLADEITLQQQQQQQQQNADTGRTAPVTGAGGSASAAGGSATGGTGNSTRPLRSSAAAVAAARDFGGGSTGAGPSRADAATDAAGPDADDGDDAES